MIGYKMTNELYPVANCWVLDESEHPERRGIVKRVVPDTKGAKVVVAWLPPHRGETSVDIRNLRCGFKVGMEVLDSSPHNSKPLGHGEIVRMRSLGSRDQALVDFFESGYRCWIPYENLSFVKGVRQRWSVGNSGQPDDSEKLRLRLLAHAITVWNENTGSLSRLEIDPLPHQIHLVHHILSSGNFNWLIADDVGLGKTIEVGMLLAALRHRGMAKRVLLITPAGLTRQWQDELFYKFGFENFEIYGEDFHVNEKRQWKMHDYIIASMDKLKSDAHIEKILQADAWDMVIVDEGHRLTRKQYGMQYSTSERYKLVEQLRSRTPSIVILSATPHQGDHSKFVSLLELLRPERRNDLGLLALNPEIIGEMVYRNYKADVTDANGNFIFRGKQVNAVRVDTSDEAHSFDSAMQKYLTKGYAASSDAGKSTHRAIGFVMTTYRKLAASSSMAILNALRGRLARLTKAAAASQSQELADARYFGEWEESFTGNDSEFFTGEIDDLVHLIKKAEQLSNHDLKMRGFLESVIGKVLEGNPEEKILVFTEYRSTQKYLQTELAARYGDGSVYLINGSMDHRLRKEAIHQFETLGRFLISTEAGGEGINLQRQCHIMVNYDLPWNPMRLVQRVGRLYRYGQMHKVVVFNLHASGSLDDEIIQMMYARMNQVVTDLMPVQRDEFTDAFSDDVLGEIAELIDLENILEKATVDGVNRTQKRIDEALDRARGAAEKQRELFKFASRFDASETNNEFSISSEHIESFVLGMFVFLQVEIVESFFSGKVLRLRLPEQLKAVLQRSSTRLDVTFDRAIAASRPNTEMLDLSSQLMHHMLDVARHPRFGGLCATVTGLSGQSILAALLRWQDQQGHRLRQSFEVLQIDGETVLRNTSEISRFLLAKAGSVSSSPDPIASKKTLVTAETSANSLLSIGSNQFLHPESIQWVGGAWIR